ncbi:MAG: hypothetical protein JW869_03745 [Candidatus Omnitrophica bacterium]|nr:hypothetical protein [Candidatus Omnitrophota bacterium]
MKKEIIVIRLLGVFIIIMGSILLLWPGIPAFWMLAWILDMANSPTYNPSQEAVPAFVYLIYSCLFVGPILAMITGIFLMFLKNWARISTISLMVLWILYKINVIMAESSFKQTLDAPSLVSWVLCILSIYYLTRPRVKSVFFKKVNCKHNLTTEKE